jgi:Flp pilus assembly protein CpaB
LGVTAEQAAELELAASRGTIGLALRSASDTDSGASQARNQNIAGNPATPAEGPRAPAAAGVPAATTSARQASAQPTMWGVTVIRGDSMVKHEFPDRGAANTP